MELLQCVEAPNRKIKNKTKKEEGCAGTARPLYDLKEV